MDHAWSSLQQMCAKGPLAELVLNTICDIWEGWTVHPYVSNSSCPRQSAGQSARSAIGLTRTRNPLFVCVLIHLITWILTRTPNNRSILLPVYEGIRSIDAEHNQTNQSVYHFLYFLVLGVAIINLVLVFLDLLFHLQTTLCRLGTSRLARRLQGTRWNTPLRRGPL